MVQSHTLNMRFLIQYLILAKLNPQHTRVITLETQDITFNYL